MVNLNDMKLPPNNREAEMSFLCCVFLDPLILEESDVIAGRFYGEYNQIIFSKMLELHEQKKVIDLVTLGDKLPIEYRDHLYDISGMVMTPANWKDYQGIIQETFMKRKLLKAAKETEVGVYESIPAVDIHARLIRSIETVLIAEPGQDIGDVMMEVQEDMGVKRSYTCKYGYERFDKVLGGYKEGQLVVIGARPGIGKTALMLELIQKIVGQGTKVAVYSLEMQNKELAKRLFSNRIRVDMAEIDHVRNQALIREVRAKKIEEGFSFICFDGGFTNQELQRSIRKTVYNNSTKIVFIDHIGLIQGQGKTIRNEWIGSITASLKVLAKELKITIVILSQLNRDSAKKYDAPQLESLRDSGNIEQDADIVIMLHRDKDPEDDNYNLNKLEVFIRKNRNGKLGIIRMNTEMQYMSMTEDTNTTARKSESPKPKESDENDLPF